MDIKELTKKHLDYAVATRRYFHENPEPSMKEFNTQKRIMEELKAMGIEHYPCGGTGVVGIIKGKGPGKTIALRADIDALEVQEENPVPYKSKIDGMMHACGHDTHIAGLLTAAKILNEIKDEFDGTVKLIFQPGEEVAQGALAMIKDGVMEGVDGIFGIHIWNDVETGKVSVEAGPRMASAGMFKVYITGKGGHGAMPHQTVDASVVASAIVMNLQSIVNREINPSDPAVVTVGMIRSGSRWNVISGEAYMEGTTRCYSMEVNNAFEGQLRRIVEMTAQAYRAEARMEYTQMTIPTINDPMMSAIAAESVKKVAGEEGLVTFEKTSGGEDFAFFSEYAPSAFAFVGSKNTAKLDYYPHHHPKFDIDEDALGVSAGLYTQFALDFLSK
ncbi:amidohydrolase [Gudongella oleilytica]|uniref:amidohydrolase n=1 Tax=Gudongella oleilytica TaxID=1582259 RepID=UPI002A371FB3|nr:amidohydrolase [Gudongella oleilytica]MDY0256159.1 amidohydrolase [Gudongella oleilytica]